MLGDNTCCAVLTLSVQNDLPQALAFVLQIAYRENVLGSFSELQLLGRACASDLSEHIQVRGAFHSVSR